MHPRPFSQSRGRTNHLDGQIVSDKQIILCANRANKFFDKNIVQILSDIWPSGKTIFHDDLPVEMNKSTRVRHKVTSDKQMLDNLYTCPDD